MFNFETKSLIDGTSVSRKIELTVGETLIIEESIIWINSWQFTLFNGASITLLNL